MRRRVIPTSQITNTVCIARLYEIIVPYVHCRGKHPYMIIIDTIHICQQECGLCRGLDNWLEFKQYVAIELTWNILD